MRFCESCGCEISSGMKFCIQCGAPVPDIEDIKKENRSSNTAEKEVTGNIKKSARNSGSRDNYKKNAPEKKKAEKRSKDNSTGRDNYAKNVPVKEEKPPKGKMSAKTWFLALACLFFATTVTLGIISLSLNARKNTYFSVIKDQNSQIYALKKEKSALNDTVTSQKNTIDVLRSQNGEDVESLKSRISSLESENSSLQNRLSAAESVTDGIKNFLNSPSASSYNKDSEYYASSNVVIVKKGATAQLKVHSTSAGGNVSCRRSSDIIQAQWSMKWDGNYTLISFTGKQTGTSTVEFTREGDSRSFTILVVVV